MVTMSYVILLPIDTAHARICVRPWLPIKLRSGPAQYRFVFVPNCVQVRYFTSGDTSPNPRPTKLCIAKKSDWAISILRVERDIGVRDCSRGRISRQNRRAV